MVVIADEAHRSQYGFKARVERKTGEIAYGFAKYLRDALPNASFIGFTGTPIEKDDANTPAVFGQYIDVYDISRAVEDGATVPIYYESRLARIELPDEEKPRIDAEIEDLTEDEAISEQERLKRKWSTVEALVGAEKRLKMVAEDLVAAFRGPGRSDGRQGHGGLHEPPHLRRIVQRDHRPSPRLAFRRRQGRRDQNRHNRHGSRS